MAIEDLEKRVGNIEDTLELLNTLPQRVGNLESQFLQFRKEVRQEFSAIRQEIAQWGEATRAQFSEIHARFERQDTDLRRHIQAMNDELFEKIRTLLRRE